MPVKPEPQQPGAPIEFRKSDSLANVYANHSLLQSTGWDIKVIFGEVDQSISPNTVVQHTAVTLPWTQAKILAYFLQIHLAAHEVALGRVAIPQGVIPDIPVPPRDAKDPLQAQQLYKVWSQLHDAFLAANPEAAKK